MQLLGFHGRIPIEEVGCRQHSAGRAHVGDHLEGSFRGVSSCSYFYTCI